MSSDTATSSFGSCCEALKEAMEGDENSVPLIAEDDGVLFMSVALLQDDDDTGNTYDTPVLFCPFCGTKLQTAQEVEAKMANAA